MIPAIPIPARDGPFEAGFWNALDRGEVAHQHCAACDSWFFPPRWRCECGGDLTYRTVSGKARLWSWTQVHAPVLPAFEPHVPYFVGIAELAEAQQLRMVGPVLTKEGDPPNRVEQGRLSIGMELTATIGSIGPDTPWPAWIISASHSQGTAP